MTTGHQTHSYILSKTHNWLLGRVAFLLTPFSGTKAETLTPSFCAVCTPRLCARSPTLLRKLLAPAAPLTAWGLYSSYGMCLVPN